MHLWQASDRTWKHVTSGVSQGDPSPTSDAGLEYGKVRIVWKGSVDRHACRALQRVGLQTFPEHICLEALN